MAEGTLAKRRARRRGKQLHPHPGGAAAAAATSHARHGGGPAVGGTPPTAPSTPGAELFSSPIFPPVGCPGSPRSFGRGNHSRDAAGGAVRRQPNAGDSNDSKDVRSASERPSWLSVVKDAVAAGGGTRGGGEQGNSNVSESHGAAPRPVDMGKAGAEGGRESRDVSEAIRPATLALPVRPALHATSSSSGGRKGSCRLRGAAG